MYTVVNTNKYQAKSSVYNGRSYHSKAEAAYARELDLRLRAGEFKSWTPQVRLAIKIIEKNNKPVLWVGEEGSANVPSVKDGITITNYYVDFKIENHDGTIQYVEVKGMETRDWRIKWKLCEAFFRLNPNYSLKIVKVRNSWRSYKPQKYEKR